jgi:hypothetical protein
MTQASATPERTTTSSDEYHRERLTTILDNYDEFSTADAKKACSAILAIALLRGDTPLAVEALLRNGRQKQDQQRFMKIVGKHGFAPSGNGFGGLQEAASRYDKDTGDVIDSAKSLKSELKALANASDDHPALSRMPLLSQLEPDELETLLSYLELVEIEPGDKAPEHSKLGYSWYLRGQLLRDGEGIPMSAGVLLNDDALSTLRAGSGGCLCAHLSFQKSELFRDLANFGHRSAEVEWSRMIWKALHESEELEEHTAQQLADMVDAAQLIVSPSEASKIAGDGPFRVLPVKESEDGLRSFDELATEALEVLCPVLIWTTEQWDELVES